VFEFPQQIKRFVPASRLVSGDPAGLVSGLATSGQRTHRPIQIDLCFGKMAENRRFVEMLVT
jgi:hypothetical protein